MTLFKKEFMTKLINLDSLQRLSISSGKIDLNI